MRARIHQPDFDPRLEAIAERPAGAPACPPGGAPLEAQVTVQPGSRPEVVECDVTASRACLLVLSVPWSGGWRVQVDGGPTVAPHRVDGVIMGTPIPAGSHRVTFRYHAPGFALGCWIALLATLAAGAGAFVVSRRTAA